jgi:6-phosphogluconate dehydrogenase
LLREFIHSTVDDLFVSRLSSIVIRKKEVSMKIGFIGLGRMGLNMVERLLRDGHEIIAYARREESRAPAKEKGAMTASSLEDLVKQLEAPRVIWVMVPSGEATENTVDTLSKILEKGDIIVDGGNSNYKDSQRRAQMLEWKGIEYVDCGTSGGIWGLKIGYCLMIGGKPGPVKKLEPIFRTLAPEKGFLHVGPHGSGHFVKMIHNGIEYGMLEAYAEGFELLRSKQEFGLDLQKISNLWNHGSVVRSWLLELTEEAFAKDPQLEKIEGYVEDSGEGRWTVQESIEQNVPAPALTIALMRRFRSRQEESFASKYIAALRNEFGGHNIKWK